MEFKIKLLAKKEEATDTKTFLFTRPKGFSYLAGQYVYLTLPHLEKPDERGDTRHFTLSSSPTEENLTITVRMRAESGYKQTLDAYPTGTEISMRGPNGFFTLERDNETEQQVMIAGGIGITPYRSIIKYVADKALSVPIHLIYSNSIPEEIVFKNELDKITKEHKNIQVTYTITRPEESKVKWTGPTSRIDANFLKKHPLLTTFWLCGPPAMVGAMEEVLSSLNIPSDRVKIEKFTGY